MKDPGMYFLPFLFNSDFLVLNILSLPAGNATSACVSISRFGKAKREMDTVDQRVYYMVSCQVGKGANKQFGESPNNRSGIHSDKIFNDCHLHMSLAHGNNRFSTSRSLPTVSVIVPLASCSLPLAYRYCSEEKIVPTLTVL